MHKSAEFNLLSIFISQRVENFQKLELKTRRYYSEMKYLGFKIFINFSLFLQKKKKGEEKRLYISFRFCYS